MTRTLLPGGAAELAQWKAFQAAVPDPGALRVWENGTENLAPFAEYAEGNPLLNVLHNSESPELYSVHPSRLYSLGREMFPIDGAALPADEDLLAPARFCLVNSTRQTCRYGAGNNGWNQGIMNAALLGDTALASAMLIGRAETPSAIGYRFPAFGPHEQDYEPAADHFANMNMGLQWMLLQPADDADRSALLFGAWPCEWDVDFKLAAPGNTTVEATLAGGKVTRLVVTPPARARHIHVVNCA